MRFAKLGADALAKLGGVEPNLIPILSGINMGRTSECAQNSAVGHSLGH